MKYRFIRTLALLCALAFVATATPVTVSAEELAASFSSTASNVSSEAESGKPFEEAAIVGEVVSMREENVKHFRRDDGTYVAAIYNDAVHYQDGNDWKEIDNTLVAEETRDNITYYKNTANKLQVRLPDKLTADAPITVQNGDYTLQWTLQDGQSKTAQITPVYTAPKETVTRTVSANNLTAVENQASLNEQKMSVEKLSSSMVYNRVYDDVNLRYDVVGNKFKESIVLEKKANRTEYVFFIQAQGLTAQLQEDGSVRFFASDDKEPVFVVASPFMFDSNHECSQEVEVRLSSVKGGYQYTLIPSQSWLQAEERQYPVTIDPTILLGKDDPCTESTEIYTGSPGTNYSGRTLMYTGSYKSGATVYECQSLLKFSLPNDLLSLSQEIVHASLNLAAYTHSNTNGDTTQVRVHRVTSSWTESTVNWNTRPSYDSTVIDYAIIDAAETFYSFNITSVVSEWANGGNNYGLLLKAPEKYNYNDHVSWCTEESSIENAAPTVLLSYRTVTGIEDYWTYTTTSVGRNATVAVNNATGALTAIIPDCGVDGSRLPVSISHIYNSADDSTGVYGAKWRLNYQMKVEPVTLSHYTINSSDQSVVENTEHTFLLTDGDGTKHYFVRTANNTYRDEDGLGLTLTEDASNTAERYTITDKDKNTMSFNSYGNLRFIRDTNTNYIEITYDTDSVSQKITRIRDGAGRVYALSYSSNRLTSITDPANRTTEYTYDGNGILVKVTYPDGVETQMTYSNGRLSTVLGFGQTISITYNNAVRARVSRMTHFGENPTDLAEFYSFEYGHNHTDITTITNAKFTYQFNEYLHTMCVISHEDGRAQSFKYGKPGGNLTGEENRLLLSSAAKKSTFNHLHNSRLDCDPFETISSTDFSPGIADGVDGSVMWDSSRGHIANGSIKVTREDYTDPTQTYIYGGQNYAIPTTGYYAISAFVNTNGQDLSPGPGAIVRLERWRNGFLVDYAQACTTYTPQQEWRRLGTTLYCAVGDTLKVLLGTNGTQTMGEMWFDDVQLELLTESINEFNLLENSDFHRDMDAWESTDTPWTDLCNSEEVAGITVAPLVAMGRVAEDVYVYQQISVTNGQKGDAYSIGTWAKGASAPLTDERTYGVRLDFENKDGTTTTCRISCNPAYEEWQFVSGEAIADKEYTMVTFYLEYGHNVNDVMFALPFLYRDNYGQSFAYDNNGNVISAADQTQNATTYAYNNNQLNRLASPTGSVQMMSSNQDTNNLISVMTTNGQRYEYEYDDYGNMTKSRVGSDTFATTLWDGGTYILRNATTGNAFDSTGLAADSIYRNWRWIKNSTHQPITLVATDEPDVYMMHPYGYSSLRVDVEGGVADTGARIQLWNNNNNNAQKFKIERNDNGTFIIRTKISNYQKCIDGQPGDVVDASNGAAISQQPILLDEDGNMMDDPGQQWYFILYNEEVTDDYYIESSATYDEWSNNYVESTVDALGNVTSYSYDLNNNLKSTVDANGIGTRYNYDTYGIHNTNVLKYDGTTNLASVSYSYNSKDQLTKIENDNTYQRYEFRYDNLGRLSAVFGDSTSGYRLAYYTYNTDNLLSKLTYGNGHYVNYLYDGLGRQTKMWYNANANSGVETVYNDRGLVGILKDHITNTRTRYEYDMAGRPVHVRRTTGSEYDRDMSLGELFYFYDNKTNRLAQHRVLFPFASSMFNFTYGDLTAGEIPDNLYSLSHNGTIEIEYAYDALGRLETRTLSVPNIDTNYYYTNVGSGYRTSGQVKLITTPTEDFLYNYDAVGNITQVYKDGVLSESYTYDGLNQMTAATVDGKNYTYTYDVAGNIRTANEDGISHTYRYDNILWKDQLTAYDGQTITYDAIGNPLTYRDGMSFTWQNGRQLASSTKGGTTTTYTYNADGGRKTRTVGNKTYNYYYIGGVLYAMTVNNYTLYFMYDDTGRPYSFIFNIDTGSGLLSYTLYYKYNLQGDVVGIYSTAGTEMLWYTYDPWGKLLSASGPMSSALSNLNPFLYRGYVYDYESGLYYCNSRYYDPEIGRWINADGYISTGQGVLGYNMYAYCGNNPINLVDFDGDRYCAATTVSHEKSYERSLSCHWQNQVVLEKYNPEPIGKTEQGNVYLVKDPSEIKASFPGDVIILDNRGPNEEDNIEIPCSFSIKDKELQYSALSIVCDYEKTNPTGWNRSVESMMLEWEIHNTGAFLGNYIPFLGKVYAKSIHTCFENKSEGWSQWDHIWDAFKKVFG